MSLSHEDIRHKLLQKVRASILKVIESIRSSEPQLYVALQTQLEEYKNLIEKEEDIPLIIKNEKPIEDVGRPDVEVFGGKILIEVKVKISEFRSGFDQLSEYAKFYPYAEYAILTNYQDWEFYRVEKGVLTRVPEIELDYAVEAVLSKGVKVPLTTENVRNMFSPVVLLENDLYQIFQSYQEKNGALFEAYRNIIKRLYEKASEEEIERLYIKHTLIQMIVSSCLTSSSKKTSNWLRACSGADVEIEIVLPYLNWWERLLGREMKPADEKILRSLLESVYSRALLLDWESGGKEDVFRELYEILIDAETRRKIGEYYTPLWLVEYMIDKVSNDLNELKGKIVLDPFCGSGTFLVVAFYKKVQEGEAPDNAIKEIIGFDINPLAVSIARAELMIAYQTTKKGAVTPLVFNTDSASLLLRTLGKWEPVSSLDELKELERAIEYVNSPIYASTDVDFSEILRIEMILRQSFREVAQSEDVKQELNVKLGELKKEEWRGSLTRLIVETLTKKKNANAVAKLIEKYGNGVWAVSITSLFAPHIIRKVRVDIVITNPPWAQLTEPKGMYGKLMRDKGKELLKGYEKSGQILTGADISSVLLHGCIDIVKHEVAFLMPKEVVYTANSYHGLGKILTYSVAKDYDGEIVEVNLDAFGHGRIPCMVFLKKEDGKIMCYSMNVKWGGSYSKALRLSNIECTLEKAENYEDYMEKIIAYTRIQSENIRKRLGVEEVAAQGNFLRGLFGGEAKKGAKKYAGLVFENIGYDKTAGQYSIRLYRTNTSLRIPNHFVYPFWKKLIYMGEIFPFYLNDAYDVLLSSEKREELEEFLKKFVLQSVSEEDKGKIELLIEEFKQPQKLKLIERNKYYVIYRRLRTFASFVLSPQTVLDISENMTYPIVIDDSSSYVVVENEEKAHYYSAILNYLAYKVIEKGGVFERHQFLRPLITIMQADLEWRGRKWQLKVAKLGKRFHQKAAKCFKDFIRRGMRVEECFERLINCDETRELFKCLIETINENVNEKKLYESLQLVCKLSEGH